MVFTNFQFLILSVVPLTLGWFLPQSNFHDNDRPEVLDKFLAVSHMHSDAMAQELSLSTLDNLLLKPLAVPLGVDAEYSPLSCLNLMYAANHASVVPDLWRTRLDPEDEREEKLLVEQYKNEFELTTANYPEPGDLYEFANVPPLFCLLFFVFDNRSLT
jgi:hypothetical protein